MSAHLSRRARASRVEEPARSAAPVRMRSAPRDGARLPSDLQRASTTVSRGAGPPVEDGDEMVGDRGRPRRADQGGPRSATSTSRSRSARRPTSRTTASASRATSALAPRSAGWRSLAKELLPALDNLDRALEEAGTAADPAGTQRAALGRARPGGQDDPLLQGVRLVRSEFADALARLGIESYAPAGETFDPSLHEAMASVQQPPKAPRAARSSRSTSPGIAWARASSAPRAWSWRRRPSR